MTGIGHEFSRLMTEGSLPGQEDGQLGQCLWRLEARVSWTWWALPLTMEI